MCATFTCLSKARSPCTFEPLPERGTASFGPLPCTSLLHRFKMSLTLRAQVIHPVLLDSLRPALDTVLTCRLDLPFTIGFCLKNAMQLPRVVCTVVPRRQGDRHRSVTERGGEKLTVEKENGHAFGDPLQCAIIQYYAGCESAKVVKTKDKTYLHITPVSPWQPKNLVIQTLLDCLVCATFAAKNTVLQQKLQESAKTQICMESPTEDTAPKIRSQVPLPLQRNGFVSFRKSS